ncbi:MAG TPA: hypothetical protein VEI82_13745, partial [Myxococcota bacterium]|nr:hypothetical protein [Myxococcota bacterium]
METLVAVVGAVVLGFGLLGVFAAASQAVVALHVVVGGALLVWAGVRGFRRITEVMGTQTARGGANSLVQAVIVV